jgi:hypothetical protein
MCALPNFSDFYQRPLIPIGEKDRLSFLNKKLPNVTNDTHWLIALEGHEKMKGSEVFHWRVVIFPSNTDGTFDFESPFFASSYYSFNEATEYARKIEKKAKDDQIYQIAN